MILAEEQQQTKEKQEELAIDLQGIAQKSFLWMKKNYVILLLLIPIFLSIYVRIQPAYLPILDASAENNIYNSIKGSVEQTIAVQYPNLPEANKQALVLQKIEEIYAQGTIDYYGQQVSIAALVEENARQLKEQFQDEYGLTYLGEIDPWYFYRLAENYLDHGYEGDVEINGRYYDDHQFAGTPLSPLGGTTSKLPHFHVMVEVFLYKVIHLFIPHIRFMTLVYFLPVLLATLSVIPAFFIVRKIGGNIGALVAATIVGVHPAFVGRTVAGFSDTDSYNILFPLLIMWLFIEAMESNKQKNALLLAGLAGFFVGIFSIAWGGWWYIYDFLLGVCFISLWFVFVKEYTATKERKTTLYWILGSILLAPLFVLGASFYTLYKAIKNKEYRAVHAEQYATLITVLIFLLSCALFVSLFSSPAAFSNAVQEPFSFTAIKDVGVVKIWPNVLTTVAEFNPASLPEILNTASFGMNILLLCAFLGIGYVLFEREESGKHVLLSLTLAWVIGVSFLSNKISSHFFYTLLLLLPIGYCLYRKVSFEENYFVGVAVWYALLIHFIPWFAGNLFSFFIFVSIPLAIGIFYALLEKKKIDLKYGLLLCIWFIGTIYASTKGVRFIMVLVPALSVATGLGVAFLYKLWTETLSVSLKIKQFYVQSVLILAIGLLLFVPITVGYNIGYNQLPLINDQWYEALQKINEEAAPNALVNSWWDFGHWFKAIADRPVTFDGGSQDTPQAHWIGKVLLTDNEQEAIAILRMLDCGGNTAYDLLYNTTNDSYLSVKLTKEIIMQTEKVAKETLLEQELSEEQAEQILKYTHCDPPENYFITSQDMVGKAPVWAHFGSWNFDRAHVVNLVNSYAKEEAITRIQENLEVGEEEAQQLYLEATTTDPNYWIAPWPSYVSSPTGCWQENELLFCNAGFFMNLTNGIVQMQTTSGYIYPKQVLYINSNGEFTVTDFSAGNYSPLLVGQDGRSYGVAIMSEGTDFTGFVVDTDLLQSMFTRLFFFKGHNLKCFDLFDYQRTVTNEEIYVWKVDWVCTDPNVVFENVALEEK